jgi:hypothetical protein
VVLVTGRSAAQVPITKPTQKQKYNSKQYNRKDQSCKQTTKNKYKEINIITEVDLEGEENPKRQESKKSVQNLF